jgi:hypothetical protein
MTTWKAYNVNITLDSKGDIYKTKEVFKLVQGKDRASLFKNNNLYSFHIKGIKPSYLISNTELYYLTDAATNMKLWVLVDDDEEPILKNNLIQVRKYEF